MAQRDWSRRDEHPGRERDAAVQAAADEIVELLAAAKTAAIMIQHHTSLTPSDRHALLRLVARQADAATGALEELRRQVHVDGATAAVLDALDAIDVLDVRDVGDHGPAE